MNKQLRNILLPLIFTILLFSGCSDKIVDIELYNDAFVKIVSPVNNSSFLKHEEIHFEAYLLSQNDTISCDSVKWEFNTFEGMIIRAGNFNYDRLVPASHRITCFMYKNNKEYLSMVEIEVENAVSVDTLFQDNQFSIYKIPKEIITCIGLDGNGNILVGTEQKGIYYNKDNSWINYDVNDGLIENEIQTISLDLNNELYIGYGFRPGISKLTDNGWLHIATEESSGEDINNIFGKDIHYILFDENNILWAANHTGKISKYINGNWVLMHEHKVDFHHPSKILFDKNKVLWGSSDYASIKYDGQNWDSVFVDAKIVRAHDLAIDKNNNVWFACGNGLYKISESDTVIYNTGNSNLPSNNIIELAVDSKNNLWIGTENGLVKFDGTEWNIINLPLNQKFIRYLAIDKNDKIWFGNSSWDQEHSVFGSYKGN